MTTKIVIKNAACSNGDLVVDSATSGTPRPTVVVTPGQKLEEWVSGAHAFAIEERWPTGSPADPHLAMGETADDLIAAEAALQDKMWGVANERADNTQGQMMLAAMAQLDLLWAKGRGNARPKNPNFVPSIYPADWGGFRDYGSDIANLVVAAAYLRQEIKRKLVLGESTERAKRKPEQVYDGSCQPNPVE